MFQPLTKPDLGSASPDARLYCRPTCFVDRPHELDDACLRIADTMVWFAAWHISLRDAGVVKSAIVTIPEFADWVAAMPDHLVEMAAKQRTGVLRPRGALQLGERTVRLNEPQLMGILNVTPDSFSDGGKHVDSGAAIDAGFSMSAASPPARVRR
jgi:dihydropteroate synthase